MTIAAAPELESVAPGDAEYDQARRLYNGAIDHRPELILRPRDARQVARAILHAREAELPLAVRGGGHSLPGHSMADGGVTIDLCHLRAVEVDPTAGTARVGGGALLADLDRAAQRHGLVVPAGHVSHTGVAGLTLGGGVGWLTRSRGLTIDSLLGATVVTAEGEIVRASEDEHPDLFWALRGGGGNFGVVTEFTFRATPLGTTVLAGLLVHPLERAREALAFSRDFMAEAPDELTLYQMLFTAPPQGPFPPGLQGRPVLALGLVWSGDLAAGERVVAPLRAFGEPLDLVGPMPYVAVQAMQDEANPHGICAYNKAGWLDGLSDAAIDVTVDRFAAVSSPFSALMLARMGGTMSRVAPDATAFPHRSAEYMAWIISQWPPGFGEAEEHVAWCRSTFEALRPFFAGGVYVNGLAGDEPERLREAYGVNYARLREVKRRWDPDNAFRLNANIRL